jgi:S-(hydroxymethyl)glutathione dehydrogenase / alcohol dehydrogenase
MSIKNIKAAVLYELNKPLRISELTLPELLPGQVLVKIFYSGVCRSQLMEARGYRGNDPWLPHLLGHEASGEVISTGEGVTKVQPGDKVIMGWIKGDGIEAPGAKYTCGDETINSGRVTTFSNYSIVSENRLVKLPKGIPLDVAVLFGCALPTGAGIVFNELKPTEYENIIVIGLGGIGLSAMMALNEAKPNVLIAVDISDEKLKLAKAFGASHTINSQKQNVIEEVKKILPNGADACIESGGKVETIELGFSLIRKGGGRVYFASHPPEGQTIKLDPFELISGKTIYGSWGGGCCPDTDVPRLAKSYLTGHFPLEKLVTKRYTLEQVNEALEDLEQGRVFRPLIEMKHS